MLQVTNLDRVKQVGSVMRQIYWEPAPSGPDVCSKKDYHSNSTASAARNAGLVTTTFLTLHILRRSGGGILAGSLFL